MEGVQHRGHHRGPEPRAKLEAAGAFGYAALYRSWLQRRKEEIDEHTLNLRVRALWHLTRHRMYAEWATNSTVMGVADKRARGHQLENASPSPSSSADSTSHLDSSLNDAAASPLDTVTSPFGCIHKL